ncbi:MAG: hypothetical protein PVH61_24420 [Candidatus Aminicenantes bacterium]|jgi:hypothetical protein
MSEAKKEDINSSLPLPYEDDGTDYWQGHLDSWVQSGLSQAAYCRRHDLDYGRFRKWKERLSTYPKHSSIKLVEVKRDFSFNASPQFQSPFFGPWCSGGHSHGGKMPPEINRVGDGQPSSVSSGIRFWCGPFCIEIDVGFSSESLSQLIRTLQNICFQGFQGSPVSNSNGDNDNPGT